MERLVTRRGAGLLTDAHLAALSAQAQVAIALFEGRAPPTPGAEPACKQTAAPDIAACR